MHIVKRLFIAEAFLMVDHVKELQPLLSLETFAKVRVQAPVLEVIEALRPVSLVTCGLHAPLTLDPPFKVQNHHLTQQGRDSLSHGL